MDNELCQLTLNGSHDRVGSRRDAQGQHVTVEEMAVMTIPEVKMACRLAMARSPE